MPIDATSPTCPTCGGRDIRISPVLHHLVCAYVGPGYDFEGDGEDCRCPKCQRPLRDEAHDWEVIGTSGQCLSCGSEFVVAGELTVASRGKS